jgi:hypothetical protein
MIPAARGVNSISTVGIFSGLFRPTFEFLGLLDPIKSSAEIRALIQIREAEIQRLEYEEATRGFFIGETRLRELRQQVRDLEDRLREAESREPYWD